MLKCFTGAYENVIYTFKTWKVRDVKGGVKTYLIAIFQKKYSAHLYKLLLK